MKSRWSSLNDKQWFELKRIFLDKKYPLTTKRTFVNGVIWHCRNLSSEWRDVPTKYGKWNSVYKAYARWKSDGRLDLIVGFAKKEGILDE